MTEAEQIAATIAALEAQRATLGDAVVETALAPLRDKLAALQPAPDGAQQLKIVTLLFVDVVGSTALGRTLDPEDTLALMDGALKRFAAIVEQHDGRVLRFTGDGLCSAFGVEVSREDDPERAVRAGLALIADAAAYAGEVEFRFGLAGFAIRVGVNTGQTLLGGGVEADNSAMGLAINLTKRMEESAPVGGLRISHDTYRHIRGVFDVMEEPPIAVKGVAEPVRTYVVIRPKPRAFRATQRGIEGVETRMVGRDGELANLREAFETVLEDRALALINVVGEAGLGKSRLLDEFKNWLDLRPERIWLFQGRAQPQSFTQPYGLLRDLISWRFQIQDSDLPDVARAKLAAGIAPLFGASGEEQTALLGQLIGLDYSASQHIAGILQDAKQIRNRAFHAAAQFFRRLSGSDGGPIALLLDDIHWADDGSLDFVNHMVQSCRDLPILVLCLARPSLYERRPLWASGLATHRRIDLAPLGKRSSRELAEMLLNRLGAGAIALRELIISGAEGNPFYMEEITKMLIDDGVIVTGSDPWRVVSERLIKVNVPPTLTGVLQARIDALPSEEKTALQQASIVGYVFWDEALAAIDAGAKAALPALARRELVVERETSAFEEAREYVFKHHVLHQVTYESVLKRHKREHHQRTADWLTQHSGERESEYLGLIADHYERAGNRVNAAVYLRRAGEDAAARYANDAALDYLGRALALTPENDPETRFALLLARVQVENLQGARDAQVADIAALEQLAERLNDDARRAEAAAARADYAMRIADYPAVIAAAERAIELARKAGDQSQSIATGAAANWAFALAKQGDHAGALPCAALSLRLARQCGDRRGESVAHSTLGTIAAEQGDYYAARLHHAQSLQLNREIGDREGEADNLNNIGEGFRLQGDYAASRDAYECCRQLSREIGSRRSEAYALAHMALVVHSEGRDEVAVNLCEQAQELARGIGERDAEANALTTLGHAQVALGQLTEAVESYRDALSLNLELGRLHMASESLAGLARVALAEGETDVAVAHMDAILAYFSDGGSIDGTNDPLRIYLTCYRVLVAANDNRADKTLLFAHDVLMQRSALIPNITARRMFTDSVPYHREIREAWARREPDRPPEKEGN